MRPPPLPQRLYEDGNVLAFVGSSAGCTFFPDHVTNGDGDSYDIEVKTYQAPKFEGGADYAVQQGAGMVIINKSDAQVEAAARFLKWFYAERLGD